MQGRARLTALTNRDHSTGRGEGRRSERTVVSKARSWGRAVGTERQPMELGFSDYW